MHYLTVFIISFFTTISFVQAQYNILQQTEIAGGDTAMYIGHKIEKKHLGDTLEQHISKGLHRIVISPKIKEIRKDLLIKVIDEEGNELPLQYFDQYVAFYWPKREVSIINITMDLEDKSAFEEGERIAGLYYVYTKNIIREAPVFELQDVSGNTYSNKNLMGKLVVFNFWHISCRPCIKEIPKLNELTDQYKERDDIIFIAVTHNTEEDLAKFLEKKPFSYRHVADTYDMRQLFVEGQSAWPTHIIINKEGKMVFQYFSANNTEKHLQKRIEEFI